MGVFGTALYYVIALGAVSAELSVESAHLVAFGISIVTSYFGQKIFTFRVRGENKRNASRFIVATAFIAAIQLLLVSALGYLGFEPLVLFAISSVYYPIASFVTHSLWTFRPNEGN